MPIYEYACHACGAEVEKLQRMSDDPLKECPECGQLELVRKVSAAGFRLKGGGWYETDFKSSGKRNLAGAGKEAADSGAKGGDSKAADSAKPAPAAAKPTDKSTGASASAP